MNELVFTYKLGSFSMEPKQVFTRSSRPPYEGPKADRFEIRPFLYSRILVQLSIFTPRQFKYLKSNTKLNLLKLGSKVTIASPLLIADLYTLT